MKHHSTVLIRKKINVGERNCFVALEVSIWMEGIHAIENKYRRIGSFDEGQAEREMRDRVLRV